MNKKWYAVYTKQHLEKKVVTHFSKKNEEVFCPLNKRVNSPGNNRKAFFEVLFPTYVFVFTTKAALSSIMQHNDVINLIFWLGKPAIIQQAEIDSIKKFTKTYSNIKIEKTAVIHNGMVETLKEPLFYNSEEKLTVSNEQLQGFRIKSILPSLGYIMIAETKKKVLNETIN